MVQKLKLGMIGGGIDAFIGDVHRIAARLDGYWDITAGALSSTVEKSLKSGKELGLERIYGSWQEMIEKETIRPDKVDAVAIVTPNHMHAEPAIAAMKAGFHVICDKPLTTDLDTAHKIQTAVEETGKRFILTHNYSAYPMVRMAKEMVASGKLGDIRVVQVEYIQGWLATKLEEENKQAAWRTDPKKSGPVGCLGDIGTHAFQLCEYVSGLQCQRLLARLNRFVPNRSLDDDAQILMDFNDGATGMLWSSQVAIGQENALSLRIFGDKGGLVWRQETPNVLEFSPLGEPMQILSRGGAGFYDDIHIRTPAGHPEGYLEAFAQIYNEAALMIQNPNIVNDKIPSVSDGVRGLEFITACLKSTENNNQWVDMQ